VIRNILGILVGAVVALIALILLKADSYEEYIPALIIGGIGTFLWPLVMGVWATRRVRSRREEQIQAEVARQVNEQSRPR
jgi:hypothetical protein